MKPQTNGIVPGLTSSSFHLEYNLLLHLHALSAVYIRSNLLSAARCQEVGFTTSHRQRIPKKSRRKMLKRALKLALVLTSCVVKRLTYANEYSIAISHKVGSEWDS